MKRLEVSGMETRSTKRPTHGTLEKLRLPGTVDTARHAAWSINAVDIGRVVISSEGRNPYESVLRKAFSLRSE